MALPLAYIKPKRKRKRILGNFTDFGIKNPPKKKRKKNGGLKYLSKIFLDRIKEKGKIRICDLQYDVAKSLEGEVKRDVIHRRVYDFVNVLASIDLVKKKDGKVSLTDQNEVREDLKSREKSLKKSIENKEMELSLLERKEDVLTKLIKRNTVDNPRSNVNVDSKINVPFTIIEYPKNSKCKCQISDENREVKLSFEAPFNLYGDIDFIEKYNFHEN